MRVLRIYILILIARGAKGYSSIRAGLSLLMCPVPLLHEAIPETSRRLSTARIEKYPFPPRKVKIRINIDEELAD
jgi:hypothetical protein